MPAPGANRACGDCTLCCKVMTIDELAKPAGSWCKNCDARSGCKIYSERPTECRTFSCLWLIDERLGPPWKPNKSKIVITTSEDGLEIRCDPGFSDAWRKEPFKSQIHKWAEAGELSDVTVLVIIGEKMTLVTHGREFDLGVVRSDERIVREVDGTRVVNVKVMKASDLQP
ncbi:MAG: hypothetical protein H7312_27785 [Tardiphaga sp.]|nr:hypothetical protein [Tardiphaga sp.]